MGTLLRMLPVRLCFMNRVFYIRWLAYRLKNVTSYHQNNIHQFLTLLFPITDTARQHSSIVIMVCVVLFIFREMKLSRDYSRNYVPTSPR